MNIFRLVGDLAHLLAVIILLLKIWKSRSCAGISGKTQILFALTYTTRYLDLVTNFVSLYNTVMKVVFILASYGTLVLMFYKFKATYDRNHDTFRMEFLVAPCVILALVINHEFSVVEIFVDIQHLSRSRGHSAPVVHVVENRRGRIDHQSLFIRVGNLPCFIHRQLDLSLLLRGILRSYCRRGRLRANGVIRRLLLSLCYACPERQEDSITSLERRDY